jgi:hypothetical protein
MGGFDHSLVRQNLSVPENFDIGVVIAIGYPGSHDQLPIHLQERELSPRMRHLQNGFVMNHIF